MSELKWVLTTGRDIGYETGDCPVATLDFGIAMLTVSFDPYGDGDEPFFVAELDFEAGYVESGTGDAPEDAIAEAVDGYIDIDSVPEIPDSIVNVLLK